MARKKKKTKNLQVGNFPTKPLFCGFPLITKNINQLWNFQTLENVKL